MGEPMGKVEARALLPWRCGSRWQLGRHGIEDIGNERAGFFVGAKEIATKTDVSVAWLFEFLPDHQIGRVSGSRAATAGGLGGCVCLGEGFRDRLLLLGGTLFR